MFALGSVQPQLVIPVGHLASAWSTLRTVSHPMVRSQGRTGQQQTLSSTTNDTLTAQQLSTGIKETLHELGLHNLAQDVKVETINPVLQTDIVNKDTDQWQTSHISTQSFFSNKHGHTEQELLHPESSNLHIILPLSVSASRSLTTSWLPHTFLQQTRSFTTKRLSKKSGLGQVAVEEPKAVSYFKNIVGIVSPTQKSAQNMDKIRHLLDEHANNPEQQEKVKVAFAEGYMAGQDTSTKPGIRSPWQRFLRGLITTLLVIAATGFLFFKIFPIYTRNSRLNNLFGDVGYVVRAEDVEERFDDVKGADEVKEELIDVVEFLKSPDRFTALGAKLPKGLLLCGPPGSGKTLLARAVAGEANVPFIYASGAEFDEVYVGVGAKKVRDLFTDAKNRAPCVIFLDEIDAVGAKRTSSETHPYANQTINQLLTEMDGFKQNEGIIILGATNRREHLDSALMRPGRFDMEIHMQTPDYNGRKEIFQLYLSKVKASRNLDIDRLARMTSGYNGADIANLVNQAAMVAGIRGAKSVSMEHLEYAREKIIMGPMKKHRLPCEETNRVTAYHEAGHAIVAYFSKGATPPHKVTIMPRGQTLGHTAFVPEKDQYNMSKKQLLAEMDVALGGRVAEEIILGSDEVTTGAGSDFEKANAIAEAMVKRVGMSEKAGFRIVDDKKVFPAIAPEYSAATMELVDNEIKRLLQESYDRCKSTLRSHSKELKDLAEALMKYETLDQDEIKTILEGKKFVKKMPKLEDEKSRPFVPPGSNKAIKALIEGTKLPSTGSPTPSGNARKDSKTEHKPQET